MLFSFKFGIQVTVSCMKYCYCSIPLGDNLFFRLTYTDLFPFSFIIQFCVFNIINHSHNTRYFALYLIKKYQRVAKTASLYNEMPRNCSEIWTPCTAWLGANRKKVLYSTSKLMHFYTYSASYFKNE